jgi:hypothetical protein
MAQCRVCHETYQDTLFETRKCHCGFSRTAEQMEAKRLMYEYQELLGTPRKRGARSRMAEIRDLLRPFFDAHVETLTTGK